MSNPSRRYTRGGSATADRLAARASNPRGPNGAAGLRRQSVGEGEVFSGELASRALQALGARAMTVDRAIIVNDRFDPSRPEDRALFEHERHHLEHSGGVGENSGRDHEEVAARAVERMVLHHMKGGTESHDVGHATAGKGDGHAGGYTPSGGGEVDKDHEAAVRGYLALRARGMPHAAIVEMIAREVMTGMNAQREQGSNRFADKKGLL